MIYSLQNGSSCALDFVSGPAPYEGFLFRFRKKALSRDPRRTPRVGAGGGHIHTLHTIKCHAISQTSNLLNLTALLALCAGF